MPIIDSKNLLKTGKITIDVNEIRDDIKRDLLYELDKRFHPMRYALAYILDVIFELHPTRFNKEKEVYDSLTEDEQEKYIKKVDKEIHKLRRLEEKLNDTTQMGHCACCKCEEYLELKRIANEVIL
jgi:ATP phosphoribosyltransferase regulatory subunit HisZ